MLELINQFSFGVNSSSTPLKSFALFVLPLIIYHLNGVMDLHSKCCRTALLCMPFGPELQASFRSLTSWNRRGKYATGTMSAVTRLTMPGRKPALHTPHHCCVAMLRWMLHARATFHTSDRPRRFQQTGVITLFTCHLSWMAFGSFSPVDLSTQCLW